MLHYDLEAVLWFVAGFYVGGVFALWLLNKKMGEDK